jgi:hypothetical protein
MECARPLVLCGWRQRFRSSRGRAAGGGGNCWIDFFNADNKFRELRITVEEIFEFVMGKYVGDALRKLFLPLHLCRNL